MELSYILGEETPKNFLHFRKELTKPENQTKYLLKVVSYDVFLIFTTVKHREMFPVKQML